MPRKALALARAALRFAHKEADKCAGRSSAANEGDGFA